MDNYEEYLLRVLRRTHLGLQDSLIPAHSVKLSRLVEKFERAQSISSEVAAIQRVQGFGKCGLAMEWLLNRTAQPNDSFSPEQFESDVLLLNEKLFEAFLNQPFDMPDFSKAEAVEPPQRHIHQNIQVSADEFFVPAFQEQRSPSPTDEAAAKPDVYQQSESFADPNWSASTSATEAFESALASSSAESTESGISPPLSDIMEPELMEATQRVAQSAVEFIEKTPNERPIAMAVIRVSAKAALESAKVSKNLVVQDFYSTFVTLINYADQEGKIRSDVFADIIRDIGDRLFIALKESSNGVNRLKNLTKFIHEPKELFQKK